MFVGDIRTGLIEAMLRWCADEKGLGHGTLVKIRWTARAILRRAKKDGLIEVNPADEADVPATEEIEKQRTIPTDDEVVALYCCDEVPIELRLLVMVARIEGGMRTRDLTAWWWTMIDLEGFAWCVIPRTKTRKPQRLEIHAVLRAPLRKWWEQHGCPTTGPVFPVTKGPRKGEARKRRGVSFADRLRRAFLKAGVMRRELHEPTEWSLPVDFHSLRRAFGTAAADADMTPQKSMDLMAHDDLRAHQRYVLLAQNQRPRPIPDALVPKVHRGASAQPDATGGRHRSGGRPHA